MRAMVQIRFIEADEIHAFRRAVGFGFGREPGTDEGHIARYPELNPADLRLAAFDRGRVVATFGSYDLELTMPGRRRMAIAGTTQVTVHPTHRRRGILTEMMARHLDQALERGQPAAGLWASEETIYGRFGYGPAAWSYDIRVPYRAAASPPPPDDVTVHPCTADEARPAVVDLYERTLLDHPGRYGRSELWWTERHFTDPERRWDGAARRRWLVAERDGEPVGTAAFVPRPTERAEGTTEIVELTGIDEDARRALFHVLANVDLYRNVRWSTASLDEPLLLRLDRFRSVERRRGDTLWLRPLDVAASLTGRRYEQPGTVVLRVVDEGGPAHGTYRLHVDDRPIEADPAEPPLFEAEVAATSEPAEVELPVATLGRLLLGGASAATLDRAGLLSGSARAVDVVDRLFATRRAPNCIEVF